MIRRIVAALAASTCYGRDGEGRADLAEAERLKPGIGAEYAAYGFAL